MSIGRSRLRLDDALRVASTGLRSRPLRAVLSALGIAIGTAAIVAVLGLSSSSQAGLVAEIDRLGTNLLTVETGEHLAGGSAPLPAEAPARLAHLDGVEQVAHTGLVVDVKVYRNPLVPAAETSGLQVQAASLDLPSVLRVEIARGTWLNEGTAHLPVAVLGATAAARLGIDRIDPDQRIWLGHQWFHVAGILAPAPLARGIDESALVGYPVARDMLGHVEVAGGKQQTGPPSTVYVRVSSGREVEIQGLLARTANPGSPSEVNISRPSAALAARAAAQGALNTLFVGLGIVSLAVGAVGVANTMVISVLERRSEIGLRRSLGATRRQIRTQFLSESILIAAVGGVVGTLTGIAATVVYASSQAWAIVIPDAAWLGGPAAAVVIGAVAGLAPATRASRLAPTVALNSV